MPKTLTSPREARELAAETARAAEAALRLALDVAPISQESTEDRDRSYRLYKAMALEEYMGWVTKYASHIHLAPEGVKGRLREEMRLLASHLNRIIVNLDEADAQKAHDAKPD